MSRFPGMRALGLPFALLFLLLSGGLFTTLAQAQESEPAPFNDGRYIIKLRSQGATVGRPAVPVATDRERGRRAAAAAGGLVVSDLDREHGVVALLSDEGYARLRQDPEVEYVEPDYRRYPQAESVPWGVTMVQADDPFFVVDNAANTPPKSPAGGDAQ